MKKYAIIFILLLFSGRVWAGWKIVLNEDNYGEQQLTTWFVDQNRLKISTDEYSFIYDGEDKTITIVNNKVKAFYKADFKSYLIDLEDARHIDASQVDRLLPASYAYRFDLLLGEHIKYNERNSRSLQHALGISRVENSMRIQSFKTDAYNIKYNTVLVEELWFAPGIRACSDIDIVQAVNFFRGIQSTELQSGRSLNTQDFEQLYSRGFPVQIHCYSPEGMEVYSRTLISADELEIDVEQSFGPPYQYEKRTLVDILMIQ